MKENGKLIELLNEREKTLEPNLQIEWTEVGIKSTPEIVISKKFGFIKWLVENDKIDFSREGDLSNELVNLFGRKLDNAEGVIALLSVQDEPIRFLCEIIK